MLEKTVENVSCEEFNRLSKKLERLKRALVEIGIDKDILVAYVVSYAAKYKDEYQMMRQLYNNLKAVYYDEVGQEFD